MQTPLQRLLEPHDAGDLMEEIVRLITDKIVWTGAVLIALVLVLGLLRIFGKKVLIWLAWQVKKKK